MIDAIDDIDRAIELPVASKAITLFYLGKGLRQTNRSNRCDPEGILPLFRG